MFSGLSERANDMLGFAACLALAGVVMVATGYAPTHYGVINIRKDPKGYWFSFWLTAAFAVCAIIDAFVFNGRF